VGALDRQNAALERMMRIHRMIEDGEHPNCTKIAGIFEMSVYGRGDKHS
jgi:hypothetical protein